MPFRKSQKKTEQQKDLCQPKKATHIPKRGRALLLGDKGTDEMKLQESGDIDALQRYRLVKDGRTFQNHQSGGKDPMILHHLYFIDEDLREVVQEEESIKVNDFETENKRRLDILSRKYWFSERRWWYYHSCLRQGLQQPGFDLWRSNPKWYMHKMLVEDCASRNGCCARSCGCCNNREPTPTRKLGVGHCTAECGCCTKARGFRVSEEDKNVLKKEFRELALQCPKHRLIRVASWGLVGDCYENPFDMI